MGITNYLAYGVELRDLADNPFRTNAIHDALNGQAAERLRALVPLADRRMHGAFFTGSEMRRLLFTGVPDADANFWDPSCGAGDLLLSAAERLPIGRSLEETLEVWGQRLRGSDLHQSFVQVAKYRLLLAAIHRHRLRGDDCSVDIDKGLKAFAHIRVEDGLEALRRRPSFLGTLLLNPPFSSKMAEPDCDWSSGRTSLAATFALEAAQRLCIGSTLLAILPDVLRSGSRYQTWRLRMETTLNIEEVSVYGQFDQHTDIDVVLLRGSRRKPSGTGERNQAIWWSELSSKYNIGDAFRVGVGPVVDNRDPHLGPIVPFLTARDLPSSSTMNPPTRRRRYKGRLVTPPFIAIRRTSRPRNHEGARSRLAGVIVLGNSAIAVDNHIITLEPYSGDDADCHRLVAALNSEKLAAWLDQRIRCRHLTVGVIRSVPWATANAT